MAFFLQAVSEQSRDAIRRIQMLQDLRADWHQRLTQGRASAKLLQLLDLLFETPVISIPEAQILLGMTYHGAQGNIRKLVEHGILTQMGDATYGRLYVAGAVMNVLRDNADT